MAQHRLYNLIEHLSGTENRYLFMDVLEGPAQARSQLVPDSPDWFSWLARLGSFRKAHKQRLKRYLGTTDKLTLANLEQTARNLYEAALGAIPEDEALNVRSKALPPEGLRVGPLTVLWYQEVLSIKTPTERHILNKTQTTELLSYLYAQRGMLLKTDG
jgi:hypothetical protein